MDSLRTAALHLYVANLQQMPSGHVSNRAIAALAGEAGSSLSLALAARRGRFNVDAYVFPKWKALGFETSFLGQIISDAGGLGGGIYNSFEHGAIWAQDSGNHPAYAYSGGVWQRASSLGFDKGVLGSPVSDVAFLTASQAPWATQEAQFTNGTLYAWATGVYYVFYNRNLVLAWSNAGGRGTLGYPVQDQYQRNRNNDPTIVDYVVPFQYGTIIDSVYQPHGNVQFGWAVYDSSGKVLTQGGYQGPPSPPPSQPIVHLNIGNDQLVAGGILALTQVTWSLQPEWAANAINASGAHTQATLPRLSNGPDLVDIKLTATATANGLIQGIPFQGKFPAQVDVNPAKISLNGLSTNVGYEATYSIVNDGNGNQQLSVTITYTGTQ